MSDLEVVYDPAADGDWYIVQMEETLASYNDDALADVWRNIEVYPASELAEARRRAGEVYARGIGECRVRVVRVGRN